MPDKEPVPEEEIRIGVYTCQCGGNISDVVQCPGVVKALGELGNVVVSRTNMSMCSDAGQAIIEADIKEKGVNRVVIGACAPSLHEQTFRGTVARAGLNPYFYNHVGIREQASWVHHDDPDGATRKAIRLMSAGIAKARLLEPLEPIHLEARQHALVVGGGVAGLRAALAIARRGIKVTLIEKSPFLGGHMAQLEQVFPTGEAARDLLDELIQRVTAHANITLYTQAEMVGMQGVVGDFQVEIRQQSRGISDDMVDAVRVVAPAGVPDEFNYGLTKRSVLYRPYPGCYPGTSAIDWDHYEDDCLEMNGEPLHLENKPRTFSLAVGAVVVATGFRPYEPHVGEYGYGQLPGVITLPAFIRLLALADQDGALQYNGRSITNVAFVHCVGSRQLEGLNEPQPDGQVNNYCSRVCCTATLQAANELHQRYPHIHIFDVYEDIRTYGRGHETYYKMASENRVRFLRFHDDELPEVMAAPTGDPNPLLVRVTDYLTWGESMELPVDLVVLAVGMMPNPVDDIIKLLKINAGTDRFLAEVHPKLRPVETAVPGVLLAGTAQGPMNIQESCSAAAAAAAKVAVLLGQGQVELEPFVAIVNPELCQGSGECIKECCYEDAISLQTVRVNGEERVTAVVSAANCAGCGVCVGACPNRAIDLQGWTLKQYEAMVDAIAAENLFELEPV